MTGASIWRQPSCFSYQRPFQYFSFSLLVLVDCTVPSTGYLYRHSKNTRALYPNLVFSIPFLGGMEAIWVENTSFCPKKALWDGDLIRDLEFYTLVLFGPMPNHQENDELKGRMMSTSTNKYSTCTSRARMSDTLPGHLASRSSSTTFRRKVRRLIQVFVYSVVFPHTGRALPVRARRS